MNSTGFWRLTAMSKEKWDMSKFIIFILAFIVLSSFVSAEIIEINFTFDPDKITDIKQIEIIPIIDSGYAMNASIIIDDINCTDNRYSICNKQRNQQYALDGAILLALAIIIGYLIFKRK